MYGEIPWRVTEIWTKTGEGRWRTEELEYEENVRVRRKRESTAEMEREAEMERKAEMEREAEI